MAAVTVKYLGLIQWVVGTRREEEAVAEEATLGDLLHQLGERHGPKFQDRVLEDSRLARLVTVLLDGRDSTELGSLGAQLRGVREVEVVVLGPPPAGG